MKKIRKTLAFAMISCTFIACGGETKDEPVKEQTENTETEAEAYNGTALSGDAAKKQLVTAPKWVLKGGKSPYNVLTFSSDGTVVLFEYSDPVGFTVDGNKLVFNELSTSTYLTILHLTDDKLVLVKDNNSGEEWVYAAGK